jgi:hypothetical protein
MEISKLKLNKLFWFLGRKEKTLDFSKDKNLIINQTLALGSMEDVQNLFKKYGKDLIRQEFQKPPRGLYLPSVFHFFEYLLGVEVKDKKQYIKNIYGKIAS